MVMRTIQDWEVLHLLADWRLCWQDFLRWSAYLANVRHGRLYIKRVKKRTGGYYEYLYLQHYVPGGHPFQVRVRLEDEESVREEIQLGNFAHSRLKYLRRKIRHLSSLLRQKLGEEQLLQLQEEYDGIAEAEHFRQQQNKLREPDHNYKIISSRGDRVRSRAEALICGILTDMGIPYQYEKEWKLRDGTTIKPDFTIQRQGKQLFLEVCGMMGQPEYEAIVAGRKKLLQKNGLQEGRDVVFVYLKDSQKFDSRVPTDLAIKIVSGVQPLASVWAG